VNIQHWISHHRRSLLFLVSIAALSGLFLTFQMPVSLFPDISFPRVMVTLEAGDQPIEQMVLQVTLPVEQAIRRVPGVRNVRSTTSRGSAEISVNFDWGVDMESTTLQINAAISPLLPTLPANTHLDVRRMDTTVFPIIAYSLTSDSVALTKLHDIGQYQLLPLLTRIDGVAQVQVMDGAKEEYRITADPGRLRSYGLTIDDISKALANINTIDAVGRLEEHYKLYLAVVDSRLLDIASILNAPIKKSGGGLIKIRDVAKVTLESSPAWIKVNADGKEAVLIQVFQQPGSNSVKMAKEIRSVLSSYQKHLPKDIKLANWYDQSVLVVDSAVSVRDAILIGILLASIVLWVFLRNLNITLIATLMVPAVLAITVIVLNALGMSFNIMTLGGMAAAIGLIIDDAIVMLENIVRKLRDDETTMNAAEGFLKPLAGSSAATLIIFIPLVFLSGVTGAFFKALSLTMASALLFSFLITWLIIPSFVDLLINKERLVKVKEGHNERFSNYYISWMEHFLTRPYLLLIAIIPIIIIAGIAYLNVGSGFMPSMDEGGFVLDYRAAPGTSLSETDRLLRQAENIIKSIPEVETYSRRTGAGLGGTINEANEGDFFIRLKPLPRRGLDEVMDDIRERIEHQVPELQIELSKLMEDFIGDLTAVPQPVEIKIYSDNPNQLINLAKKISSAIEKVPGLVEIKDGINPAGDALNINIDPDKAALQGMDVAGITKSLQDYLTGSVATQVIHPNKLEDIRIWIPAAARQTANNVENLSIRAPDSHAFPLSRVARVTNITGQPQVTRENLKPMLAVTARISGRDIGSVIRDIKQIIDQPNMMGQGAYYELGGLYQEQQKAFRSLTIVFISAMALVSLLLLFLYERFTVMLSIMAMPILSMASVFIGLWLAHIELNISAMIGMTMIVGIVTEASIFYFSEYFRIIPELGHKTALVTAGINRARPIIMTTVAAILTLMPLALALGQGAEMQQPLAIAIVSGLILQLPLVLIVMPIIFDAMQISSRNNSL